MTLTQRLWPWRGYTREQGLWNERELLDGILAGTGFAHTGRDTSVCTGDPSDVVRSVSVNEQHTRGVDLVCLHGFAQSSAGCFHANLRGWASLGRVHLVDWRGAGMSGRATSPVKLTTERDAIEYLVDGLEAWRRKNLGENTNMCLLAHSMGAIIATHYATRYPRYVRGVLLVSPIGVREFDRLPPWPDLIAIQLLSHFVKFTPQQVLRVLPFSFTERLVRRGYRSSWGVDESLTPELAQMLAEHCATSLITHGVAEDVFFLLLNPRRRMEPRTAIGPLVEQLPLDISVTFVYGENDWCSPGSGRWVVENMKSAGRENVKCVVKPGLRHFPFRENPGGFFDIVKEVWDTCDKR